MTTTISRTPDTIDFTQANILEHSDGGVFLTEANGESGGSVQATIIYHPIASRIGEQGNYQLGNLTIMYGSVTLIYTND